MSETVTSTIDDLFDTSDSSSSVTSVAVDEPTDTSSDSDVESNDSDTDSDSETDEAAKVILSSVPEGAMTVGDFAAMLTYTFVEGQPGVPAYGQVLPPSVYQAVTAKKNPIAHAYVQQSGDSKPKLYILPEAIEQWAQRAAASASRGEGTSASKRTPDALRNLFGNVDADNLATGGAVAKLLYAESRRDLWDARVADAKALVEKYRRLMTDAAMTEDEIDDLFAQAAATWHAAAQAKIEAKEAEKGAKSASSGDSPDA